MFEESDKELIRQVRQVGESLIKNAESIVGKFEYGGEIVIKIEIEPKTSIPTITATRSFYPERFIDEFKPGSTD